MTGFGADLRTEFRRLFRPPWDDLSTVLSNAFIVGAGWLLLPQGAKDWLFTLTGPMAFAFVLESWMLSDTPATNMLANDPYAALHALPDRLRVSRLLRVKTVALACLVGPPCAAVAVAIAISEARYAVGALLCCVLLIVPFGVPAVSAWFGIRLPYHRRPLRWRWERRRPYRRTVRWVLLVTAPYVVVPVVLISFIAPAVLMALAISDQAADGSLTKPGIAIAAVVAAAITGAAIAFAPRVSHWLIERRRTSFTEFLADPDRG